MKHLILKASVALSMLLSAPFAALATNVPTGLNSAGTGLNAVGNRLGGVSTTRSLPELIGNIINVLLGALGIIFVVLTVYAGFLWMTSAGEKDKVEKAQKILKTAVMGLVITVAAYAISSYVISAVVGAAAG